MTKVGQGGGRIPPRGDATQAADPAFTKKPSSAEAAAPAQQLRDDGAIGTDAQQALRSLALDVKAEATEQNAGAEATTLGARMMGFLRGDGGKKLYAAVGLGVSLLGMVQPAHADVVVVDQNNNRHLQDVARQLAGETGEGYIHVKADAQSMRTLFEQLNDGPQFAEHLILEAPSGGVDVQQLEQLKQEFPDAFAEVRYVHVVGNDVGADPLSGKGEQLFENSVSVVGFSTDAGQGGGGPASAWLVQESGRSLYGMPSQPLSPQAARIKAMTLANQANELGVDASVQVHGEKVVQDAETDKPDLVLTYTSAQAQNSSEIMFRVPSDMREVKDGQSVLVPLESGRQLHMIELKYQDTRKLRDLEFNRSTPGGGWETFRGDEYHSTLQKEKAGEVRIKRESDHNAPWINNPVRVKVEVVDANGDVLHNVGRKFLDFHVHDAHSPDSSGYPETDNISNSYESLPQGELPDGAMLRLTPMHENRKAWEADREVAMDLSWVKPIYMPQHTERAMVRTGGWEKPNSAGYDVEAGRPIAAVFVKWTDHGGTASGRVKIATADGGTHRSQRYNVGSGETELIPLDGVVSQDGKLHIEGHGLEVGNIEILYQ